MKSSKKAWLLGVALSALTSGVAYADPNEALPAVHASFDSNGVDLLSGAFFTRDVQLSIGDSATGLQRIGYGKLTFDNNFGGISISGSTYTATVGDQSISFSQSGATFASLQGNGSTLTFSNGIYTLTLQDGTVAMFAAQFVTNYPAPVNGAMIISLVKPDGTTFSYGYKKVQFTQNQGQPVAGYRLQGVSSNAGYILKYSYTSPGTGVSVQQPKDVFYPSAVTAINLAVDYCSIYDDACASLSQSWPDLAISEFNSTVVDPANRRTVYFTQTPNSTLTLTRAGTAALTFRTDASNRVISLSDGVGTWSYAYSDSGSTRTTTVTDPNNNRRIAVFDLTTGLMASDTDGTSHTTSYQYNGLGRPTRITLPEGGYTSYTYDGRGNLTQAQSVPKSGSSLPVRTTSAGFDVTCTYVAKCNKPNWKKDANGNQTDYTYDNATGLVTHITLPAAANGLRSDTTFNYGQITPYYKNASGVETAGTPVWKLGSTVNCPTAQTCPAGSPNMTIVNYGYGYGNPQGTPNNLLLTITSQASGDQPVSVYRQRTFGYDNVGNVLTSTDWRGYATRYRYNANRSLAGAVGPDPDGSGSLRNRAVRYTYDGGGRLQMTEQGVANSQSDADWSGFTPMALDIVTYDGLGRKIQENVGAQGAPAAASVTNFSYDAASRLQCTTVRMNSAGNFGNLPASACQLGATGPYGPDRITYLGYDEADRVTSATTGYQTSTARTESTTAYTPDGLPQTQTDGKGNKTTFTYDGFDRLSQANFPTPSNGGASNASDFISYTYDANGAVTGRRNRDTSTVSYAYDAAGRLTSRSGTSLSTVSFTYDNLGRVLTAYSGGQNLTFTYDVLGRKLSETGPLGKVASQYDANDNRTRLQWPDGTYAAYTYDAANEVTGISDPTVTLASIGYDDLGRRGSIGSATSANQPWATATYFNYGSDLRLGTLSITSTAGGSQTLGYYYNPAGQLRASTSSNSAFDWTSPTGNVGRGYATNGLNQYTTSGGAALSYDGLGNVTNDTRLGYTYDGLNKLVSMSNGATFSYDGLDRLRYTSGSASTGFLYDGDTIVAEYDNSGNLLRRYVPGAAKDEFAAWYEAPGAGGYAGRRYLATDRQGSPVAIFNDSGGLLAINTYDESGQPGSGNVGRFSFNGSPYLPEADLVHLRARDYSFRLGRFMQTDSIGYGDGLNWYNYTHGDPINGWDPSGLGDCGGIGAATTTEANGATYTIPGTSFPCSQSGTYTSYTSGSLSLGYGWPSLSNAIDYSSGDNLRNVMDSASPKWQLAANRQPLCQYRNWHNLKQAEKVAALRAAGYNVATNVSIRALYPDNSSRFAVADYIAAAPGSSVFQIGEIKTGNASLSRSQASNYKNGFIQVIGNNGLDLGLEPGTVIPAVFLGVDRFPGCP